MRAIQRSAYADITGLRKRLLVMATVAGGVLASLMFTLTTGMWVLGLVLYFTTQVSMNIALGFSSSLLPHIARPDDINRVSSLGYAMGYIGGGVLLLLNTALYLFSDKLGIDSALAVRIASVESMKSRPRLLRVALRHRDARLRSAATGVLLDEA